MSRTSSDEGLGCRSEEEDEDEVTELCLDAVGRVALPEGVPAPRYDACASLGALILPSAAAGLSDDCHAVYTGESFWLPSGVPPGCALERLAAAVYAGHAGAAVGPGCGAEWWVQIRGGAGQQQQQQQQEEEEEEEGGSAGEVDDAPHEAAGRGDGVGFHWDKDEDLVDAQALIVTPHVSTVTYLTDHGAPTLALDKGTPQLAGDDAVASEGGAPLYHTPIRRGALSFPKVGKHFQFDGGWLHGALASLVPDAALGRTRITFLCNIWLGHRPVGIQRLPAEVRSRLSDLPEHELLVRGARQALREGRRWLAEAAEEPHALAVRPGEDGLVEELHVFGPTGTEHALALPVPAGQLAALRRAGCHTLGLRYGRGAAPVLTPGDECDDGQDQAFGAEDK